MNPKLAKQFWFSSELWLPNTPIRSSFSARLKDLLGNPLLIGEYIQIWSPAASLKMMRETVGYYFLSLEASTERTSLESSNVNTYSLK